MTIYKVTNIVNGKLYVGQTRTSLKLRWRAHCQLSRKRCCPLLQAAIKKYGASSFTIEPLETCTTKDELNAREAHWIAALGSFGRGYNLTSGGDRAELAEESRNKISATLTGRPNPRKGRPSGHAAWNKGLPWSPEMKEKLSTAQKASTVPRKPSPPMSLAAREKQSKAKLGKPNTALYKPIICLNTGKAYASATLACADLDLLPSKVCLVLKGKRSHTKGYRFAYVDQFTLIVE